MKRIDLNTVVMFEDETKAPAFFAELIKACISTPALAENGQPLGFGMDEMHHSVLIANEIKAKTTISEDGKKTYGVLLLENSEWDWLKLFVKRVRFQFPDQGFLDFKKAVDEAPDVKVTDNA